MIFKNDIFINFSNKGWEHEQASCDILEYLIDENGIDNYSKEDIQ